MWHLVCGRFINFEKGRKSLILLTFGCPIHYRIGSHNCTISTTVFTKISTQIFQFHVHQRKDWFLTRHLQILGSLVPTLSLSAYYLLLSISITNFMSNPKRVLIIELLRTQSHRSGGFGALIPPNKAPSPPNWNMKYYKSVEFLSSFKMSRPAAQK